MFWQFCKYFFRYIVYAKTRQRPLFLSIVGLFLSSFSLLVLQSTMGGLQNKVIGRSKNVKGTAVIHLRNRKEAFAREVLKTLQDHDISANVEYEIELLLKKGTYISPVVVHATDYSEEVPPFLRDAMAIDGTISEGVVVSMDLATKLRISYGDEVYLISPSHVDSFMGDVPRTTSVNVHELITTHVPEVDLAHVWTRLSLIQNLIRKREVNTIRIFSPADFFRLKGILKDKYGDSLELKTWEQQNSTLVWALKLETTVMVFLFVAMTMLVSLTITSGLMIFFDKIKVDLASFWILGASKKQLERSAVIFLNLMSGISIVLGLGCAVVVLKVMEHQGINLMPDIFVDRAIPVLITMKGILISLMVPYLISIIFSTLSINQFKKSESFLKNIREY